MSDWGVFSVARDIWDHPVLGCETFTKREAWMWLVSAAAWKQRKVGLGSRVVTVERGEFCFSIRFLERKWKWKPGRVERFLKTLENHDMIRDTERDSDKVYSISNYNEYQLGRDEERDSNATANATAPRQERDTTATKKKTFKHSNTEEKDISPASRRTKKLLNGHAPDFNIWYAAFPKHEARADAEKAYAKALELAEPAVLLAAAQRYAIARKGEDVKFTKLPATWLNKQCWLDEAPTAEARAPPNPEMEAAYEAEREHRRKVGDIE